MSLFFQYGAISDKLSRVCCYHQEWSQGVPSIPSVAEAIAELGTQTLARQESNVPIGTQVNL